MPKPGEAQRAESKFIVFEQFEKMNTQSVRQALSEKELAWLENLQPIAPNNLATVPGPSAALTSISETIIPGQFFANLGTFDYIISFTTVGSGWASNIATGSSTRFAPPGTFSNPDVAVWQSQYVLIQDQTAGYSVWDGSVFVRRGGVSPRLFLQTAGSGYTSAPTVTITGGSGTGATAVASVGTPQVIGVSLISGGSQYGPTPPTVLFSGGGGGGAAATAVIDRRGVTTVTVNDTGTYLTPAQPTVTFSGGGPGGTGATGDAIMAFNGAKYYVASIHLTNSGQNYTSPPTISFSGGVPQVGTPPPSATCTIGNGAVIEITVTSGGSGYTSAPAVAFSGGGGTGAVAVASVGGSFVNGLTLTNPGAGYLATDVLLVSITGGGGSGATATANVWPFIGLGNTIAVFQGRVWLGQGRFLTWTGTSGVDDFLGGNGAGFTGISDSDLVHAITAVRSYNNYLFIVGDQSVKQIGNITLSGSQTLFTILTLSSDQGSIYTHSCGSFNRLFMFVNSNGIYAVFGSTVQKISDDLDGIFKLIDFSQEPQAAIVDINNIHHIAFLVRYRDPVAGTRSIMLAFNGKKWFVLSQSGSLIAFTATSTLASGRVTTYGTSGSDLTPMFSSAATPVAFKMQTALSHHGNAVQNKKIINGGFAVALAAGTGSITVTYDTENGSTTKVYPLVAGFQLPGGSQGAEGSGRYLGMTLTGTLAGVTLTSTAIEEQENALWKSGSGGA